MGKSSNFRLLKYILCLLAIGLTFKMNAQANIKVGYVFGYSNLEQTTSIFDRFNANNPQAEKPLSPVKAFNGIELGLRYKLQNFGFELTVSSISGSTEALNVFQSNGTLGKDEWSTSLLNFSLGIENYFGAFGYGATIGTQKLKYKTNFETGDDKKTVYNESVLNSKFYLIFEWPSNLISFSIRPYVSTTWSPYNIQNVEWTIDPQSTIPKNEFDQDLIVYGISLLFYNGPQRR